MNIFYILIFLILASSIFIFAKKKESKFPTIPFSEISFTSIDEKTNLHLKNLTNKVVLVVNTASKCGFTGQYGTLQKLWQQYKDKGLVVIALPTGDFFNQEYKDNSKIQEFCQRNYGVDFFISKKITSKGKNRDAFFSLIAKTLGKRYLPKWNFNKYLLNTEKQIVAYYGSRVSPTDKKITEKIDSLLKKK